MSAWANAICCSSLGVFDAAIWLHVIFKAVTL